MSVRSLIKKFFRLNSDRVVTIEEVTEEYWDNRVAINLKHYLLGKLPNFFLKKTKPLFCSF